MLSAFTSEGAEQSIRIQLADGKTPIGRTYSPSYRPDGSFENWKRFGGVQLDSEINELIRTLEAGGEPKVGDERISAIANALAVAHHQTGSYDLAQFIETAQAQQIGLRGFLIYSPENTSLRTFDSESAIQPLGVKGEGLMKLLQSFAHPDYTDRLAELKQCLHVFQ